MKELIFHRAFLPAIERYAAKVMVHDGDHHGTFGEHGDRVLRLADAMRRQLGLTAADRFAVMAANSRQFLELYHAGFLGAGTINPAAGHARQSGPRSGSAAARAFRTPSASAPYTGVPGC